MNLLEREAKVLLQKSGITVPKSTVITPQDSVPPAPIVLKSQVHSGGRGKAGGIKVIAAGDTSEVAASLFNLPIKGETPRTLLAEEVLAIDREYYLAITINRSTASIEIMAHHEGGIEIEAHAADKFFRHTLTPDSTGAVGDALADYLDLPSQSFTLQDLITNMLACFIKNDATLLEVNPLVLTKGGDLVAGDCKMTLDDTAAFRHPYWDFEQKSKEVNFVSLDPNGTVATIANGAGLAMATVDAVADAGMQPANFLDIGGGANADSVLDAFTRIMEYPNVKAIVINIFAGITRCDEVAKAIIIARKQLTDLPPLCIRLAGTNYDEAKVLLDSEGIDLLPTLRQCLESARQEVHRG